MYMCAVRIFKVYLLSNKSLKKKKKTEKLLITKPRAWHAEGTWSFFSLDCDKGAQGPPTGNSNAELRFRHLPSRVGVISDNSRCSVRGRTGRDTVSRWGEQGQHPPPCWWGGRRAAYLSAGPAPTGQSAASRPTRRRAGPPSPARTRTLCPT